MLILVLGMMLVLVGAMSIRFPDLVESLKSNDHQQWEILGSPPSYAFSKTLGVFSWVLGRGYEQSTSDDVQAQGRAALKRAKFAKYAMMAGVVLIVVGFGVTLVNS